MSDGEAFLSRWSRLKRASHEEKPAEPAPPCRETPEPADAEPFDPASLPSLESLGSDSDYTAFLTRGVPEELQRLALRQAWRSDPQIAGFRGFAEYDWDCNAPGYGQLRPGDNLLRLCNAILGEEPEPPPAAPKPDSLEAPEPPGKEPPLLAEGSFGRADPLAPCPDEQPAPRTVSGRADEWS